MENLRKMFLAMAEDIRVIIIKLSDSSIICAPLNMWTREAGEKAYETLKYMLPGSPSWNIQD